MKPLEFEVEGGGGGGGAGGLVWLEYNPSHMENRILLLYFKLHATMACIRQ